MFDFLDGFSDGLQTVAKSAGDLFGSVGQVYSTYANYQGQQQDRELNTLLKTAQIDAQRASIDAQRYAITTNADIAKINASAQLRQAQNSAALNDWGFAQSMANIQRQIGSLGGGNNTMLFLTLAGVAIAAFQLIKSK